MAARLAQYLTAQQGADGNVTLAGFREARRLVRARVRALGPVCALGHAHVRMAACKLLRVCRSAECSPSSPPLLNPFRRSSGTACSSARRTTSLSPSASTPMVRARACAAASSRASCRTDGPRPLGTWAPSPPPLPELDLAFSTAEQCVTA
eukprot:scaffold38137_cov67-Phaeocystis_antarctica.AAC.1